MDKTLQSIVQTLEKDFGAEANEIFGEVEAVVSLENIVAASQKLRDDFDFALLSTITAVDYFPEVSPRYHIVYVFNSLSKNLQLTLRVPVDGEKPIIPTLTGVYKNANWRERELWDMFGIKAEGHPDLRRILMPDDWDGHPLRKDYPLGYEEPQFTFNFEEIDLSKPKGEM
ncbi:MAG: NADH-quinone oxidoreductase subunit C [Chloroflexi bacterium]|nr:NADH-quinone oxidoreductase subunit C [Chloroflexota bacterium]